MKNWKILLLAAACAVPLAASAAGLPAPKAAPTPEAIPAGDAKPGTPAPTPSARPGVSPNKDQAELEKQLEQARRQMDEAARHVAELSMQLNSNYMQNVGVMRERLMTMQRRGFLGIDLGENEDDGATISGITPGGPADKAGLREGDTIVSINGNAFKASGSDSASDKLVTFMRTTKPGDSLKVAYNRDGKSATTTVTAGSLRDFDAFFIAPPVPPVAPVPPVPPVPALAPLGGLNMFFSTGGRWGEMQLVDVTPGLGQYFGTDKGLLVLHVPKDSTLQLQEGDVIVQLGGRNPGSPSHAMRILGSYGPGENVKIDIMRKGKPQTLNVTLPKDKDDDSMSFNWSTDSDDDEDTAVSR
ncbi:MAG TPA: PDZ domain-containing protein [Gammaproteobacteria bacterium]|jgi:predicted metalloprotease with PDZ domain|nr:PDZ domain-containing protein [Gammaproteobacteria bacterium]